MKPKRQKHIHLPYWMDQEAKGRAAKRRARPRRDMLSVRHALDALKLRWCGEVSFWNPTHTGKQGNLHGGLQWVDLVAHARGKTLVILVDYPSKRWHEYEKTAWRNKTRWLEAKHNLLILPPNLSTQEYQMLVWRKLKQIQPKGV